MSKPTIKLKTSLPLEQLLAEADRYHTLGLEQAKKHMYRPDPLTERMARDHFIRAETYKAAAGLLEN